MGASTSRQSKGASKIRTKIVATLGNPEKQKMFDPNGILCEGGIQIVSGIPALVSYQLLIEWFVREGVDVIRLNMAHVSLSALDEIFEAFDSVYRGICQELGREVALLADLQGPKIRIADFFGDEHREIELAPGDKFILHTKESIGNQREVTVLYGEEPFQNAVDEAHSKREMKEEFDLAAKIRERKEPTRIYLGDGEVVLDVDPSEKVDETAGKIPCIVRAVRGGGKIKIKGGRGVTFKDVPLPLPCFTSADQKDLEKLAKLDKKYGYLAYVAISFIKNADEVREVRRRVKQCYTNSTLGMPGVIAKIETREAVENIDEIIEEADGIMVARGDLGLQCDLPEIPGIQKKIIRKCILKAKPVITATQMLDSMEESPEPTRAEVTDVYNAIFDGTDAVMLSGETAGGLYPFEAIHMMREIAKEAENDFFAKPNIERRFQETLTEAEKVLPPDTKTTNEVSYMACHLSSRLDVKAIITPTTSGQTARMVSRFRPEVDIVGAAHDERTKRKLVLSFGVWSLRLPIIGCKTQEDIFREAIKAAKGQNCVQACDDIVITAGYPPGEPGTTNVAKVQHVD